MTMNIITILVCTIGIG